MARAHQLLVEVYGVVGDRVQVPVQSAVVLCVWTYLRRPTGVSLTLVEGPPAAPALTVNVAGLEHSLVLAPSLPSPLSDCCLPVFSAPDSDSCVAGLCAVLRQVVKHSGPEFRHLLGFREGCLFACAEVSLWTKFCEIDVIEVVNDILSADVCKDINVSNHLARFEEHLKQPVRMHNVDKLRKEMDRESVSHDFAEGHLLLLSDLMIVPCVRVVIQALDDGSLSGHLAAVLTWYRLVERQCGVTEALCLVDDIPSRVARLLQVTYHIPTVPAHSLYKSDPKRYKPKLKQFTRQEDVEAALSVVDKLEQKLDMEVEVELFGHEVPLDWQVVPAEVLPDVPQSRLARKQQQLENLAKAVIKVACAGDRIVDFCCGSGHLGIVLAHHLPQCHVVLLDNKEESLARAQARVRLLGLPNVTTVQCNLDYFRGAFQIGVSLHACGVATDLVMHSCLQQNAAFVVCPCCYGSLQIGVSLHACGVATDLVMHSCLQQNAAFVVCPCCYGSLQSNHVVTYPRSAVLASLSLRQYLVLSHCADQTHQQLYAKSAQGERCMAVIDRDRCLLAREKGYSVSLAKLVPHTCSPKNNLLVGIPRA